MTSSLMRRLSSQNGFTIVEVVTSAFLLVVIVLGVFASLDTASGVSGSNKSRAIASGLAQEDLERMRSLKAAALMGLDTTRDQVVAGVPYTIHSETNPVIQSSGSDICESNESSGSYLEARSTVTWPAMRGIDPVRIDTLLAQPNPGVGALAVTITDGANAPVPNIAVTVSGAETHTASTNEAGCVLFANLPIGEYTVSLQAPGFIDADGQPMDAYSKTVDIVGQSTTTLDIRMDRPGTATILFRAGSPVASVPATLGPFTLENAGITTGTRLITAAGTSYTASLFPFAGAYMAFAGGCAGNDPTLYGRQPDTTFIVPPSGTATPNPVPVYLPGLRVTVRYDFPSNDNDDDDDGGGSGISGSGPVENARVVLTRTDGCGSSIAAPGRTDRNGRLPDVFLPYGQYEICATVAFGSGRDREDYEQTVTGANTSADATGGAATVTFDEDSDEGDC